MRHLLSFVRDREHNFGRFDVTKCENELQRDDAAKLLLLMLFDDGVKG